MAEHIECRKCRAPSCTGCNTYILSQMLHRGKFNCLMDEHHCVNPEAEFAPVVHGRWVDNVDKDGFLCNAWRKCSVCGGLNFSKKPPYCPNCGAKMDLQGE